MHEAVTLTQQTLQTTSGPHRIRLISTFFKPISALGGDKGQADLPMGSKADTRSVIPHRASHPRAD